MTKDIEINNIGNNDNKTVKKSLLMSKNSNKAVEYLTFKVILAFIQLKKTFTKTLTF